MNKKAFVLSMVITLAVVTILCSVFLLFFSKPDKINVLVVGVDKDGVRSDVNMLFSVDPQTKSVNLLSIPRDTRVKIGSSTHVKLNACIGKENGEELLMEKVTELTGLEIDHFCIVNFESLHNVIDILGGVEFDVPMDMDYDDPAQDLHIHLKKGKQVLNGEDAEGLLRFRSGYASADLGRINTQQAFLKEMVNQKLQLQYLPKAIPVFREITKNTETDLSMIDILRYALCFRDSDGVTFQSFTLPGSPKTIGGASYYICDSKSTAVLVETHFKSVDSSYVYGDGTLNEKVID